MSVFSHPGRHHVIELPSLDPAAVEIAGRNWLTAQLLARRFEVAVPEVDRGIDLIIFREIGAEGIRALPLQLKCSSGEGFSLHRKYEGRGIPMAYIWNVLGQPEVYFLTYDEALVALGDRALQTTSWMRDGYYAFTRVSDDLRSRLVPFRDRWDWVGARLDAQPTSGAV